MAQGYDVTYEDRAWCGEDIATFRFTRPEGYNFSAGQWLTLSLDTVDGRQTETFSHCSAPSDPYLELATRRSPSAFKGALFSLEPGQHVHLGGPGGRMHLQPGVDRVAFLIGGVGITPIRCILRDTKQRRRRFADALLLFGNRDEACVPFGEELGEMSGIGLRLVLAYEHPSPTWQGERGFITAEMVRRHVDPEDGRPFMITGPPPMVAAMEKVLDDLGIPGERRIIERFGPSA